MRKAYTYLIGLIAALTPVLSSAETLQQMTSLSKVSVSSIATLVLIVVGAIGVIFVGQGLYGIYTDHKSKAPSGHRWGTIITGSLLLVTPIIIELVANSMGLLQGNNILAGMSHARTPSGSDLVSRATALIPFFASLIEYCIMLIGLIVFSGSLVSLAKLYAPNSRSSGLSVSLGLVFGAAMINIGYSADIISNSIFMSVSSTGFSYTPKSSGPLGEYSTFVMYAMALLGLYGLGRGLYQLSKVAEEKKGLASGITHVVGGILCLNLDLLLNAAGSSMGGVVQSVVNVITGG